MLKIHKQTKTVAQNATYYFTTIKSPIGELLLVADDSALTGVYFGGCKHIPAAGKQWTRKNNHPVLVQATTQLVEYFAGKRKSFSLPIHLSGTDFQQKVWEQIALIPHGQTVSYSDLATRAGKPLAVRAAGTSTGRNPVSIIIPCHRVMGKNGGLHGFAGGLDRKRHLLGLESHAIELLKK